MKGPAEDKKQSSVEKRASDNQKAVQTVSPRQWISSVVVYLLIPFVLLVCGGDFGWGRRGSIPC